MRFQSKVKAMEQITVQIRDKKKAKLLLSLLTSLDFVDSVSSTINQEEIETEPDTSEAEDFFALAGLWEGRDVDLASLRQKAWPRQSS